VGTKVDKPLSGRGVGGVYKRPNFPTEFKRQLVEQSLEPGASVALIARGNDINANLLFKWRRQYLEGAYGLPALPEGTPSKLVSNAPPWLPVNLVAEAELPVPLTTVSAPEPVTNICEIEFDRARLRIRGDVPPEMLRLLIRELSR
jgi:transposase